VDKRITVLADDDPLFPVQAFFNAISASDFVETLADLARGIGHGINVVSCQFPAGLDPGEEPFEGVRCYLFEEQIVVDDDTFARFVRLACQSHLSEHPEDRDAIDILLIERGWA
jgi:hypothetical protein